MATLAFKRGATFRLPFQITDDDGTPVDTTGWTVTCHVRKTSGDALVSECTVTEDDSTTGDYEALVTNSVTEDWPLGEVYADIRALKTGGDIDISESIDFVIVREATRS